MLVVLKLCGSAMPDLVGMGTGRFAYAANRPVRPACSGLSAATTACALYAGAGPCRGFIHRAWGSVRVTFR